MLTGYTLIKETIHKNVSLKWELYYQDYTGIWKGLTMHYVDVFCTFFDRFKNQKNRFLPTLNDGCPRKAGNYTVGPAFVNRYRKDWEPDLKMWIPPYFIEADNWKAIFVYFYKDEPQTVIGNHTLEFRIFNENMSQ